VRCGHDCGVPLWCVRWGYLCDQLFGWCGHLERLPVPVAEGGPVTCRLRPPIDTVVVVRPPGAVVSVNCGTDTWCGVFGAVTWNGHLYGHECGGVRWRSGAGAAPAPGGHGRGHRLVLVRVLVQLCVVTGPPCAVRYGFVLPATAGAATRHGHLHDLERSPVRPQARTATLRGHAVRPSVRPQCGHIVRCGVSGVAEPTVVCSVWCGHLTRCGVIIVRPLAVRRPLRCVRCGAATDDAVQCGQQCGRLRLPVGCWSGHL